MLKIITIMLISLMPAYSITIRTPVKIFDYKNNLLYEYPLKGTKIVNIPKYTKDSIKHNSKIIAINKPFRYYRRVASLPSFEHFKTANKKYDIIVESCIYESIARTRPKERKIFLCEEFENVPLLQKVFIIAHEVGHQFYRTETKCDIFALRACQKLQIPPSQIILATRFIRMPRQRIERLKNLMQYAF